MGGASSTSGSSDQSNEDSVVGGGEVDYFTAPEHEDKALKNRTSSIQPQPTVFKKPKPKSPKKQSTIQKKPKTATSPAKNTNSSTTAAPTTLTTSSQSPATKPTLRKRRSSRTEKAEWWNIAIPQEPWIKFEASRKHAETVLKGKGIGTFIIRMTKEPNVLAITLMLEDDKTQSRFVLCIQLASHKPDDSEPRQPRQHYQLKVSPKCEIKAQKFETLQKFVDYYAIHQIDGHLPVLLNPGTDESKEYVWARGKTTQSFRSMQTLNDAQDPSVELAKTLDACDVEDKPDEIPRSNIKLGMKLGQGAFGVVVKGTYTKPDGSHIDCACKTLKDTSDTESMTSLLAECRIVWAFDHLNIVACFGQVTMGSPAMIIFEFMSNGSLIGHLQSALELPKLQRLMKMAIDIASGMCFLETKNFVHRDLAARNVLVNEEMVCKISDFGLSRDLDQEMYYQSEGGMVPIRWTPPEAYKFKKYSTSSDVWSYGITLYEIWTKGAIPYGTRWTNMNVMLNVERGFRLAAPKGCPKAVYQLMIECWNPMRRLRPTFAKMSGALEMAYGMLFPEEEDGDSGYVVDSAAIDENYDGLEQVYVGFAVPDEDAIDETYLDNPSTATSPRGHDYYGMVVESPSPPKSVTPPTSPGALVNTRPDRFAYTQQRRGSDELINNRSASLVNLVKSLDPSFLAETVEGFGDFNEEEEEEEESSPKSPSEAYKYHTELSVKSLRRRTSASDSTTRGGGSNNKGRVSTVESVLALSRKKEALSEIETTGILNIEKESSQTLKDVPMNVYKESVGRAREVTPLTDKVKTRVRCTCRRATCVCGAF